MATALEANPITKSIRGGAAVASTQLLQHAIVMQALNRHDVLHLSTVHHAGRCPRDLFCSVEHRDAAGAHITTSMYCGSVSNSGWEYVFWPIELSHPDGLTCFASCTLPLTSSLKASPNVAEIHGAEVVVY